MKVLLLRPPNPKRNMYASVPPLGLGYLATTFRQRGHTPDLWDLGKERFETERFVSRLRETKPEMVGVQAYSRDISVTRDLVRTIRTALPDSVIVIGGPHPSTAPEHTLQYIDAADYAFVGEAEIGFADLADGKTELSEIPGLVRRDSDGTVLVNPPAFPDDLDGLGFPAWDLMPPNLYHGETMAGFSRLSPVGIISTSRGCPYQCSFCATKIINGRKVRYHSTDHILEEIAILTKKYGIREIKIIDDNFTTSRKRVLEFCERARRDFPGIAFSFPGGVRLDTLDDQVLEALKSTGVYSLSVAIESADTEVLRHMRKNIDLQQAREKIALIRKHGLEAVAFFIVGYPTDTEASIRRTIDFALSLDIARAHFNCFTPFPGTPAAETVKELNPEFSPRWEDLHIESPNYTPKGISLKRLRMLRKWGLIRFYMRPKIIFGIFRSIRSTTQLRFLFGKTLEYFS